MADAISGMARPWQIRRVASAEADALIIYENAKLQITEIQQRAVHRLVLEEGRRQHNIEQITFGATDHLESDADPSKISDDFINYFFDKGRLIFNGDVQRIWSKILAHEANYPGSISRKTVSVLDHMSQDDAILFQKFTKSIFLTDYNVKCDFLTCEFVPIVIDYPWKNPAFGLSFDDLKRLEEIDLIHFSHSGSSQFSIQPEQKTKSYFRMKYGEKILEIDWEIGYQMGIGCALLTVAGREIFESIEQNLCDKYFSFVVEYLIRNGGNPRSIIL